MEIYRIVGIEYISCSNQEKREESGRIFFADKTMTDEEIALVSKSFILQKGFHNLKQVKEFIAHTKIWIGKEDNILLLFSDTKNIDGEKYMLYVEENGHEILRLSKKNIKIIFDFLEKFVDEL